jgi:wyosine [tRNA(Phe)-imidazoG37] synthetase (radical SAM superfamily)
LITSIEIIGRCDRVKLGNGMKYVYGPVPSRRLGQSLGIDPIPLKTCNWNCVYCQLGRTKPVTNTRACHFPPEVIVEQVKQALNTHKRGEIDWVTFVGSGEPTLHIDIGWMIREVKAFTNLPVAVITNGTLLYQPMVREELAAADAVLPSMDAGTAELYRKINRPHPEITFERHLEGLICIQSGKQGEIVAGGNARSRSQRYGGGVVRACRCISSHRTR